MYVIACGYYKFEGNNNGCAAHTVDAFSNDNMSPFKLCNNGYKYVKRVTFRRLTTAIVTNIRLNQ